MTAAPEYSRNQENFVAFYALQGDLVRRLASHPGLIADWLEAQPPRQPRGGASPARLPKAWRTARLSTARRRELAALVRRVEADPAEAGALASQLLAALPVLSYLEIAGSARPSLGAVDGQADACCSRLARLREHLFTTNYGLAQAAARRRNPRDPADLLSAASSGLLDAIDRYVPDARAARFGYFANYWIRYHLSRHSQKHGSVVSFPINQHRIGHRIERYLAERRADGLPPPTDAELCSDLKLGGDAYYAHQLKPQVVSFENLPVRDPRIGELEHFLCDPAPGPATALEEAEVAGQLVSLLRACAPPAVRVMLAYVRSIGSLADAAGDYLADLHGLALDRVGTSPSPPLSAARAFGIACGPAFQAKSAGSGP
jgi:hypothetical protein